MIVLSNTTAQTLQPGESITFDAVVLHSGTGECCQMPNRTLGTKSVKMKNGGIYELYFKGNVGSGAADQQLQLNISVGGEILAETAMLSGTVAPGIYSNVSAKTAYKNCCCDYDRVSVVNSGAVPFTLAANSVLFVKRIA